MYSTDDTNILYEKALKEEDINLAVSLDKYAMEILKKWNIHQ
ncbi:hypothetical protein [Clostridium beijerinckii]|nr:hypothetical protein [Clostridium beijerinckii]NRU74516.1 hypothetical protein [Clostridium beijerinckii]